jgi:hypothetical protein
MFVVPEGAIMADPSTTPGTGSEVPGGVGAPAPAPAPATGVEVPSPSSGASSGASPGPTGAGAPPQAAVPGEGASSTPASLRQLAAQHAPDLAQQHGDDAALFRALLDARRQAQEFAPAAQYAAQMLPYWSQFQGWLAEQQARRALPQGPERPWWSKHFTPAEYDPSWERLLERDPATGQIRALPGAPPDLPLKYAQYQEFRRNTLDRFLANPVTYIEGPVRDIAQQIAERAIQQHLAGYQDTQFANDFVQQNTTWLHARDAQGNVQTEATFDPQQGRVVQRPALSAAGQAFRNYVLEAANLGVQDVRGQQRYALAMVQRDWALSSQQNGSAASAANAAAQQQFLQRAAGQQHAANHAGSLVPPSQNLNGNAPPQNQNLGLADLLRRNLAAGGVTDRDLQAVR